MYMLSLQQSLLNFFQICRVAFSLKVLYHRYNIGRLYQQLYCSTSAHTGHGASKIDDMTVAFDYVLFPFQDLLVYIAIDLLGPLQKSAGTAALVMRSVRARNPVCVSFSQPPYS